MRKLLAAAVAFVVLCLLGVVLLPLLLVTGLSSASAAGACGVPGDDASTDTPGAPAPPPKRPPCSVVGTRRGDIGHMATTKRSPPSQAKAWHSSKDCGGNQEGRHTGGEGGTRRGG